jgi:hypothetical protein
LFLVQLEGAPHGIIRYSIPSRPSEELAQTPRVQDRGLGEGEKKKKKGGKELRKQGKKSGKMSGMRQLIVAYKKPAPHFQRPE